MTKFNRKKNRKKKTCRTYHNWLNNSSKIEVNFHLNIIICSVLSDKIDIVRIFRKNLLQKSGNHTEF